MCRFATRFVGALSKEDKTYLEETWKHPASHAARCRAHAILLSDKRRSLFELALVFRVAEPTVREWLSRWESRGRCCLEGGPREVASPILTEQEQKQIAIIQQAVDQYFR